MEWLLQFIFYRAVPLLIIIITIISFTFSPGSIPPLLSSLVLFH